MNRLAIFGFVIVAILVLAAIFAPVITKQDVGTTHTGQRYEPPSSEHWFGTDATGRDVFARVIYGARVSLQVGFIVVIISALIGTVLGALSGYYGGWIDRRRRCVGRTAINRRTLFDCSRAGLPEVG